MHVHQMTQVPSFNVLDRNQSIRSHYLLEASAGTGKTFAIENLIVRLLIEQNPLQLQEILAVTFTRAAARDLKQRIRMKIEHAVEILSGLSTETPPDYLQAILEQNQDNLHKAQRRLTQALFSFDEIQIFTIHGFCHRLLREHLFDTGFSLSTKNSEEQISKAKMLQVVHDFLRTQIHPHIYSPEQIRKLAHTDDQLEKLKENLLSEVLKDTCSETQSLTFQEQVDAFKEMMKILKAKGIENSNMIIDDFISQAPFYNKICDKKKRVKSENLEKVQNFANLFSKTDWDAKDLELLIRDGLYYCQAFDPANRSKKSDVSNLVLNYPQLLPLLQKHLEPIVNQASLETSIIQALASRCKTYFKRYMSQEELLNYDDLLHEMKRAIKNPRFADKLRQRYKAVIVDEFQDTDPIQWEIFQTLFLNENSNTHLYLVGDPKQAIYSFRKADIYTYLSASAAIGPSSQASLITNYRSQPKLIQALNTLFSATPEFIPLPRLNSHLPYTPVLEGGKISFKDFHDGRGSLHFFIATTDKSSKYTEIESTQFIPFIIQELGRLRKEGLRYKDCAILVSDRYQATRISEALQESRIPCANQRNGLLSDTPALQALQEILEAVLSPRNDSFIKTALGGPVLGWQHHELHKLEDHSIYEDILLKFYMWRKILSEQGFLPFFKALLDSADLLSREDSHALYHDLCHLAEILGTYQSQHKASPEQLLQFLHELSVIPQNEEEAYKRRANPDLDAVQILTTHSSKGLEFEIVFTLGLTQRSNHRPPENEIHETDAEKMRLLYVALTRAKQRAYVPIFFYDKPEPGKSSPIELLLTKLDTPNKQQFIEKVALYPNTKISDLDIETTEPFLDDPSPIPILSEPLSYTILDKPAYIQSYTSLIQTMPHEPIPEREPPHDFDNIIKTPHTLPSGNAIGNILHKILETIPFDPLRKPQIDNIIRSQITSTPFQPWEDVICQIVHNAIETPLPLISTPANLSKIDPRKHYRETEFIYSMKPQENYLKGIIDLVFEHQGYYYILDWKSNWLGPSTDDYQQNHLEAAMQQNNYFMQASIYAQALEKLLAHTTQQPFEMIFGGVIYVFLRGIGPASSNGIYHFFPPRNI